MQSFNVIYQGDVKLFNAWISFRHENRRIGGLSILPIILVIYWIYFRDAIQYESVVSHG